ncbi:MAG: hypothetical protein RJB38_1674 [Pseudomonadota bacterium]|jgi:glutaredoxin
MLLKWIRGFLGFLIQCLDRLFPPKALTRSPNHQAQVDQQTASLALYQFPGCPFCVKVRRQIQRLGLKIELRNAQEPGKNREDLISQGGQLQTPCLRIEENDTVRWMYESSDINQYLAQRFSKTE